MATRFADGTGRAHQGGAHNISNKGDSGHPGRMEKLKGAHDGGKGGYLKSHPGYKMTGHGDRNALHPNPRSPEQAKKAPYNRNTLQRKTFRSDALD